MAQGRGINLQIVAEYIITETRPRVTRNAQERLSAVQWEQARQELANLKEAIREHELKLEKAHQEHSAVDMFEYSRQMNALVQQISATTEILRAARSDLGQVVMGVIATEHAEFTDPRHQRYLVVTPGPDIIVAISGLNCNASSNRNACFKGGLRFMAVHTMDEVLKVRRCKLQVLGAKGQVARMLPALYVLWDTPPPITEDESAAAKPSVSGAIAGGSSGSSLVVHAPKSTQTSSSTEFYITTDVSEQSRMGGTSRARGITKTEDDFGKNLYDALQAARRKHFDRVSVQKKRLDQLTSLKDKAVTWSDPHEAAKLRELWKAVRPEAPFPGQKSEQWKDLGFQGTDPSTDFRGMGSLSLHCMLYWAQNHSQYSTSLIAQQHSRDYPICTAAINICSLVADLAGINSRNASNSPLFRVFCRTAEQDHATFYFEQVVSVCLALVDYYFVKSRSGYMDFPKVVAGVRDILSSAASINPLNFSELMGIVHEGFLPSPSLFGEAQESIVVTPSWPTSYSRQAIVQPESKLNHEGSSDAMDLTKSLMSSSSTNSDEDSKNPEPSRTPNLTPTSMSFLAGVDSPDSGALPESSSKSKLEAPTREQRVSVYFDPVTPTSSSTKLHRSRGHLDISAVEEFDDLEG
jgi:hypothetical protein